MGGWGQAREGPGVLGKVWEGEGRLSTAFRIPLEAYAPEEKGA